MNGQPILDQNTADILDQASNPVLDQQGSNPGPPVALGIPMTMLCAKNEWVVPV
jgi:hypothetical protein